MATITGTAGKDTIGGTPVADEIYGGDGNDNINGGDGNDTIYGEAGNDTLTGAAGNDVLYGGDGNDGFFGGGGNDIIYGGAGDDGMVGDGGNDVLYGGTGNNGFVGGDGNDVFHVLVGTGTNYLDGGTGHDTVVLEMSAADLTPEVLADIATLAQWISAQAPDAAWQSSGAMLTLDALQITLGTVENVKLVIDGVETPVDGLLNHAPASAASVALATGEDQPLSGNVGATDADGDALLYTLATGPANGSLALDAETGAYVYQGAANFSGTDSFDILVSDGQGGETQQHVEITIAAIADAPQLFVSDTSIDATTTINGGAGGETIEAPSGPATKTFALAIASVLADTDGSESLLINIANVPNDATLSAGTHNADGTWSLTAGQLSGLTMTASTAADFALTVTATSTEAAGGSTNVSVPLHVTFDRSGPDIVIDAGGGSDNITGSSGNDVIYDGAGNDRVNGGDGDDTFVVGSGNDTFNGGAGSDTIDMSGATTSTTINLASNYARSGSTGNDRLSSIENVNGSSQSDTITGTSGDNVINGGGGDDRINGGGGNDTLNGGDGNDRISAGTGDDIIDGGAGDDTINGGGGNDILSGGDGNDQITSGSGNDTVYDGGGNDIVKTGGGNDTVYAGGGSNNYDGGSGYDTLDYSLATSAVNVDADKGSVSGFADDDFSNFEVISGSNFDDTFYGSKNDDILVGGAGNDTFQGGAGYDLFTGGIGSDTFEWASKDVVSGKKYFGYDTITDFNVGEDVLDLSAFISASQLSEIDAVVTTHDIAAGTMVSVEIGKGTYDLVMLEGVHNVNASTLYDSGSIII